MAKAVAHPDSNIRVLYEKFMPEDQRPKKLGAAITADEILSLAGDANRGRVIFFKSSAAQCKACHAVQGFGGTLGPELIEYRQEVRTQSPARNDPRAVEGDRAGVSFPTCSKPRAARCTPGFWSSEPPTTSCSRT